MSDPRTKGTFPKWQLFLAALGVLLGLAGLFREDFRRLAESGEWGAALDAASPALVVLGMMMVAVAVIWQVAELVRVVRELPQKLSETLKDDPSLNAWLDETKRLREETATLTPAIKDLSKGLSDGGVKLDGLGSKLDGIGFKFDSLGSRLDGLKPPNQD